MGPRLCSRGDFDGSETIQPELMLQWGRGFVAAETRNTYGQYVRARTLQWGRGFVAAETRMSTPP